MAAGGKRKLNKQNHPTKPDIIIITLIIYALRKFLEYILNNIPAKKKN